MHHNYTMQPPSKERYKFVAAQERATFKARHDAAKQPELIESISE